MWLESRLHSLYNQEAINQENTGKEGHRMDNQQQLDLLKQGGSAWNAWRSKQSPSFRADLREVFLYNTVLDQCNLSRGDLSHATFWRCSFIGADLSGADLSSASLFQCSFTRANLRGTDLSHASIIQCRFKGANLSGAHLPETMCLDGTYSGMQKDRTRRPVRGSLMVPLQ
jgi:uncharacterized protein YjbI with pentapeptide repeats